MRRGEVPAAVVLRRAIAERARWFDTCRAPASSDDLHDLRVASRRLRAGLRLAASLDETKDLKRLRRGLRKLGRKLGDIREADVDIELLEDLRRSEPDRLGVAAEVALAAERHRRGALSIPASKKLKFDGSLLFSAGVGAEGPTLELFAREILPAESRRLAAIAKIAAARPTAFRLHKTRIATKKLRYAVELLTAGFLPGRARRILLPLRDLQERLGNANDWFALHRRLSDLRREFRIRGLVRLDAFLLPLMKTVSRRHAAAAESAIRRIRGLTARSYFSGIEAGLRPAAGR